MADISDINSAQTVKIVGADATGVEQTPVQSTANGGLHINLRNNAGTEIGTSGNPVQIDVLSIPATLATAAKQDDQQTALDTLVTNIGEPFNDTESTGTMTTNGDTVTIACEGRQTATIELTGTWTGSIQIEGEGPSGAWYQLVAFGITTSVPVTAYSTVTANGRYVVNCAGLTSIRAKCVAAMTGTVNVYFNITVGQAVSLMSQAGTLNVNATPVESTRSTWSCATLGLVAASSATDIFQFYGVASKVIRILRVEISATQTTGAVRDILLIKRTATGSGGTSTNVTPAAHNVNNVTVTPTIKAFTANPTSLGAGTTIRSIKCFIGATTVAVSPIIWEFGRGPMQPIELRSANDGLCINLNGVTSSGNSFNISVEWTEE